MNKLITEAGLTYLLDALTNENPDEDPDVISKILKLAESDTPEGNVLATVIRDIDVMTNAPEPDGNLISAMEALLVETAHQMLHRIELIEAKEEE